MIWKSSFNVANVSSTIMITLVMTITTDKLYNFESKKWQYKPSRFAIKDESN